jgi:hypothetical protein
MSKTSQQDRDEAIERLRELLKPGDTVHTILRHVSRSGMMRVIDLVICGEDGPRSIAWVAARACGNKLDHDRDGIRIGGCGMDMGFALVYGLSRTLFPNGFECTGKGCPANDHSNGDRDYTPHMHAQAGGYALRHRWL